MSDTSLPQLQTRRIIVITAASRSSFEIARHTDQCWSVEALYNTGKRAYKTEAGARNFALAAATRRDRTAVAQQISNWAASIVMYVLRNLRPVTPPSAPVSIAHTESLRMQDRMMVMTGAATPNQAHRILMAEWLAKHPNPTTQPAPSTRPFAKAA